MDAKGLTGNSLAGKEFKARRMAELTEDMHTDFNFGSIGEVGG